MINRRDRDVPMCTREDVLAYILGAPFIENVMSYNSLTTLLSLLSVYLCYSTITFKVLLNNPNVK